MKTILLFLLFISSMNTYLNAQSNTIDKLLNAVEVHQKKAELDTAEAILNKCEALLNAQIDAFYDISSFKSEKDSLKLLNKIDRETSDFIFAWWRQLLLYEKSTIAHDYLEQRVWIKTAISLDKKEDIRKLLTFCNQQHKSNSDYYLTLWATVYRIYNATNTRDLEEAEWLWTTLAKARISEFGEDSYEYWDILLGMSHFYKRINKETEYLRTQNLVNKKWPAKPWVPSVDKKEEITEIIDNDDEIYTIVEVMPRFPGCENTEGSNHDKKQCADQKLLQFIYENIHYPDLARENGVEGMAVVSFIVSEYGIITDAKILRDPGDGTGEEALRIAELMNELPARWIPGVQKGTAVRVKYNLPIRYKLN